MVRRSGVRAFRVSFVLVLVLVIGRMQIVGSRSRVHESLWDHPCGFFYYTARCVYCRQFGGYRRTENVAPKYVEPSRVYALSARFEKSGSATAAFTLRARYSTPTQRPRIRASPPANTPPIALVP